MLTLGLKLTHDGAVALLDGNRLVFSIEVEKLNNNPRHAQFSFLNDIDEVLRQNGVKLGEIERCVIDGWEGLSSSEIEIRNPGYSKRIGVAPYRESRLSEDILTPFYGQVQIEIGKKKLDYLSYMHVAGHVASAYCASPFSKNQESSYILVWDGGMFPRLYFFSITEKRLINLGSLNYLMGNFYGEFALYFEPFIKDKPAFGENISVAGKVMAFIAKGTVVKEIMSEFDHIYNEELETSGNFVHQFAKSFIRRTEKAQYKSEDVLATMHVFLEQHLISGLRKKLKTQETLRSPNLCFVGGCSLNIKWNSALRSSGLFQNIFIPPFTNDSGSAIGMLCCSLLTDGYSSLDWNVYQGPELLTSNSFTGWRKSNCDIQQLATLLHETGEPVIFLNGRSELGPRALGNRSILAPAVNKDMKDVLNIAKKREDYRPVAPICLESEVSEVFNNGHADPFMLYEQNISKTWRDRIPAVIHLDGTSRVQTVSELHHQLIFKLLTHYFELSGIPLLCNTSANYKGRGFFPDLYSATKWGMLNYVWSAGVLYERTEKMNYIGEILTRNFNSNR